MNFGSGTSGKVQSFGCMRRDFLRFQLLHHLLLIKWSALAIIYKFSSRLMVWWRGGGHHGMARRTIIIWDRDLGDLEVY